MEALLFLALSGLTIVGCVAGIKMNHQQAHENRKRYLLSFPKDLDYDSVLGFVRSLSGLPHGRFQALKGPPTVAFEMIATPAGIKHSMSVPYYLADYVVSQARGLMPGIRITTDDSDIQEWLTVSELSLSSASAPLRIASPTATITTVLSSLMPLKESEALLIQWVVGPAQAEAAHNMGKLFQQKHGDHTFLAVGRIAARAENPIVAKRLMQRVFTGLSTMRAYGVNFTWRNIPPSLVHKRVVRQATSIRYPCVFNATELSVVIGFPSGVSVPGLPQGQSRHLAADPLIPSDGFIIGQSNFPGSERPIGVHPEDLLRHVWVSGPTGTGKSTVLHNLAQQIIAQGYGMLLVEPKGDLVNDILATIPKERISDVILLDPADAQFPIGLNILADPDSERITSHVVALFKAIYGDSWGPRLEYILRYAVLTAALLGLSLYDVKQLLLNVNYRRAIIRQTKNPEVREFWRWYESTSDNASDSVINKLDSFLGYSSIRNMVGQPKSGFDMANVLESGKIILAPLSSGLVGDQPSAMIGSLLVAMAWQTARGRAGIPREERKPFYLMIDEFQNFMNLPMAIGDALAQARGYGLGLILANQHLAQLKPEVRAGVLANARNKVVFQTAADDARSLKDEFGVPAQDLQMLGRYEALVKLVSDDQSLPPATAYMSPPPRRTGAPGAVRQASRLAYARPVSEVEREFAERHRTTVSEVKKPSVGREA